MANTSHSRISQGTRRARSAVGRLIEADTPLARSRLIVLAVIILAVLAADGVSFAGSFRGLLDWALTHQLPRWEAITFPLMVDSFIVIGEGTVFVLVVEAAAERGRDRDDWQHKVWHRFPGWGLAVLGLAGSVAGNVGDVWHATWATKITHAVPPLAAALGLWVGLGVIKRLAVARAVRWARPKPAADVPRETTRPAEQPRTERRPAPKRGAVLDLATLADDERAAIRAIETALATGSKLSGRYVATHYLGSEARRKRAETLIRHVIAADQRSTADLISGAPRA